MLQVHLRQGEPGLRVAVDEQRQERRHRVGGVAGGEPQQFAHPLAERYLADRVPVFAQPANQGSEQGVPGAGQVIGTSRRPFERGDVPDGRRAGVGGDEVERQVDVGSQAGIGDEPDQRAHLGCGIPRAAATAPDDVQRAVDRDGQARAPGVPEEFFRHELGLHVADAEAVSVRQGRTLGRLAYARDAEAREHGGGGYEVDRDAPVAAGQPDHLTGARHVGGPQFLVRVDEVHGRADVIDDVGAPGELAEFAGGKAEAGAQALPATPPMQPYA